MAVLDPDIGEPLTFEEVKRLVEAASPGTIDLQLSACGKGRYLVAKRPLKAGEVLLSEYPLFGGSIDGSQSKKACKEEVAALVQQAIQEERLPDYEDEDCIHPCSPLVDCIAGIILTRHEAKHSQEKSERARARLKIRQCASLARTSVTEKLSDENAQALLDMFTPEILGSLDKNGIRNILHAISSNRFSGFEGQLDLMFAGSMFEHSCEPNCFAGNWRRLRHQPRLYRAMRDIEMGEPLSISYVQLPDLYLPTSGRAKILSGWGFQCTCTRCTLSPELVRAFVCPSCKLPELCPPLSGPDVQELRCLKCGNVADTDYASKCFAIEAVLDRLAEGIEDPNPNEGANNLTADVIGRFHHAAFRISWQTMQEGPSPETLFKYACAIDDLIQCVTRLHGDARNPNLLELYHIMAELETGNIEGQQHYLGLERAILTYHYPEEAEKQDDEIWNLCHGKGPRTAATTKYHNKRDDLETDLSGMD